MDVNPPTDSMDRTTSVSDLTEYLPLKSKQFYKLVFFQALWIAPWIAGTIVLPLFGAQWFGGCLVEGAIPVEVIEYCEPDYVAYNFYFTLFGSIGGAVSFMFASCMGRLMDSWGRKLFLVMGVLFWMIPRCMLVFYVNFIVYWMLCLLTEINGTDQILPALKASVSDLIDPKLRMNAFGAIHAALGLGLIVGSGFSILLSQSADNYAVISASGLWYVVLLLFSICCMQETIDIHKNRVPLNRKILRNPFRNLPVVCTNRFVLLLTTMNFVISLAEAGVMSSLFSYIGHVLSLNDDGDAAMVFGMYAATVSVVIVPVSVCFLPFLKRRKIHYSYIMSIAIFFRIVSLAMVAAISYDVGGIKLYILYGSAILHGAGMFSFAVLEGILSEYVTKDCQGVAFGMITSYRGIAGIIAPFSFGLMFSRTNDTQWASLFILVGIVLYLLFMGLTLGPLKKLLDSTAPQSITVRVSGDENLMHRADEEGYNSDTATEPAAELIELSECVETNTNNNERMKIEEVYAAYRVVEL